MSCHSCQENCELQGTDNAQGQILSIFSPQMEAIVFVILQIFFATCAVLKFGEYLTIRPVARKGYGSIAHEAKANGLLTCGP